MRKYKVSLIALICAFILAVCALSFTVFAAAEEENPRYVTLDGTNVFYANVDGATVSPVKEERKDGDATASVYYTMFGIGKDDDVSYRKNLAYKWYSQGEQDKFSLTIGFKKLDFDKYTIAFQSQQYSKTDDEISENFIIFTPNADKTAVSVAITDDKDKAEFGTQTYNVTDNAQIEIAFGDFVGGDYKILINGSEAGTFKNVKENYAKYVSSGDNAVTPIVFSAEFAEDAADDVLAQMAIYQMNGQSFEVFSTDGHEIVENADGTLSGGQINDDKAPVLCLDNNVNYFKFGENIDIDYSVIDVIASSPKATVYYYVLSATDYAAADFDYERTETAEGQTPLFKEITSSSSVRLLRDKDTFIPAKYAEPNDDSADPTEGYEVFGLAKIYIKVTDVTTGGRTENVFLDRYVDDDYMVDIYSADLKNVEGKKCNFIMVAEDKEGATYASPEDKDENSYKQTIEKIEKDYQEKINQAIDKLEDKKIYAGSSEYFYLPAFEGYATDNFGGYTDLKYSIYYKSSSKNSNSSLAYNQLAINVSEADAEYKFTIFVTDSEGNPMLYPVKNDNGEIEYAEIESSDVWDAKYADLLPFFTFEVSYKPATVDDLEDTPSIGSVGTNYNGVSFTIKGVSNTYTTEYRLYTFDREAFNKATGENMTYALFIENLDALLNNNYKELDNTRQYFTRVKSTSELHEQDENYEKDKAINWNSTGVSFIPQSTSEYYVVELNLKDGRSGEVTQKYAGVRASAKANTIAGESDWLENNVASVVLFCIAGVTLIAFIVVLVVKPKDKGDIDTIELDKPKKKKKNK